MKTKSPKKPKHQAVLKVGEVYPRYFQKSRGFLFPALELLKSFPFQPDNTYLQKEGGKQIGDCYLYVVYQDQPGNQAFSDYVIDHLMRHPDYVDIEQNANKGELLLLFRLNDYKEDYERFLQGKYSTLSPKLKAKIGEYYGVNTDMWAFMHSYLYPQQNYEHYARLLDTSAEVLKQNGELCSIYDPERETLHFGS